LGIYGGEKGLDTMIPIKLESEPDCFEEDVRKPGQKWFQDNSIDIDQPLPPGTKIPSYWTKCLNDIYQKYGGICAYVSIHIPRTTGGKSADHFIAKSQHPKEAYEWKNYRLACLKMNSKKNKFDDVLDPFTLTPETFHLELYSGQIKVNEKLDMPTEYIQLAKRTIKRLVLDDDDCSHDRAEHFDDYIKYKDEDRLKRKAPFVWYEAKRQNLL
jgi:uncharacterized protein (TIGR02646 family)